MELKSIELVLPRKGSKEEVVGEVTGQRRCQLEGCRGIQLSTKWTDGRRTYPCTKGMDLISETQYTRLWQIL